MFTLIFVLWVVAISFIFAFNVNYTTAWNIRTVQRCANKVQYFPEALLVLKIVKQNLTENKLYNAVEIEINNNKWSVKIEDGGSGFNPNSLDPSTLKEILKDFCNMTEGTKMSIIIDSFLDWKDKDSLRRLNGAEREYYEKRGYKPRDGSIIDKRELFYIRGFDTHIYSCLAPVINIYGYGKIDLKRAPLEQIKALDLSEDLIEDIEKLRKYQVMASDFEWEEIYNRTPDKIKKWLSLSFSGLYRITVFSRNKNLKYIFLVDANSDKLLRVLF